jgi:hypothetical protein
MIALLTLLWLLGDPQATAPRPAQPAAPPRPPAARPQPADTYFVSTLPASELQNKQAVIETPMGTIVLDLLRTQRRITSLTSSRGRAKARMTAPSFIA